MKTTTMTTIVFMMTKNNDNSHNDDYNNVTVRRSTRSRNEPERYGQGVPSNVIT